MSLSWLFGSKKRTPDTEPPEYTSESRDDDFRTYILRREETVQGDVGIDRSSVHTVLPYTIAPESRLAAQIPSTNNTVNISQNQNFLHGVPFKLSSYTTSVMQHSVHRNRIHANEVMSHITQLNLESFEYDFLVERSVVLEAGDKDMG